MKRSDTPEQITLTLEESAGLKARLQNSSDLLADDIKILTGLINFSLWIEKKLKSAQLTIHRLKSLFGCSTEKNDFKKKTTKLIVPLVK